MSIVGPMYGLVAALLTRMSMPPNRSMQRSTAAGGLVGIAGVGGDHVDVAADLAAAASRSASFRDDSSTDAPASA